MTFLPKRLRTFVLGVCVFPLSPILAQEEDRISAEQTISPQFASTEQGGTWGLALALGDLTGWNQRGILLSQRVTPNQEWVYGVGYGKNWFWHQNQGDLWQWNVTSWSGDVAFRLFPLERFPLFLQGGAGLVALFGRLSENKSVNPNQALAGVLSGSLGFHWSLSEHLYMDWVWGQIAQAFYLWSSSPEIATVRDEILPRSFDKPLWMGIVNFSIGWRF